MTGGRFFARGDLVVFVLAFGIRILHVHLVERADPWADAPIIDEAAPSTLLRDGGNTARSALSSARSAAGTPSPCPSISPTVAGSIPDRR